MSQTWSSLFLPAHDSPAVAGALREILEARGYAPYDPFPGGTGTPPGWSDLVRLFVAPPCEGWVRVIGEPLETALPELSRRLGLPVIHGWLGEQDGGFALVDGETRHTDPVVFERYLRPGEPFDRLRRAWHGELPVEPLASDQPPVAVIGADNLPPDIRQLAEEKGVDSRRVGNLFERLSGSLFGKLAREGGADAGDEQEQARALVMGGGRDIWNSLPGQRVRAVAGVLALPATWRAPGWDAVREAYHVHRLRERAPRMPLMPGDKEAMDAVPDALSYLPVYMGKA